MQALFSLHQDHRVLLTLTDALDAFARVVAEREDVSPGEVGAFAHAFREFADNMHYEKEEQVLLPFLVRHGFDYNRELLEQVRSDHCHDRYLIEVLHHSAQRDGSFSREDRRRVASTAAELAGVQRDLLMKQDIELFPEVVSLLDVSELARLQAELSLFDLHAGRRSAPARKLIHDLSERYCC